MRRLQNSNFMRSAALLGALAVPGCGKYRATPEEGQTQSRRQSQSFGGVGQMETLKVRPDFSVDIVRYKSGVCVFPREGFPEALATFIEAHKDLRVVCTTPGLLESTRTGASSVSQVTNFVVVTEPRNK